MINRIVAYFLGETTAPRPLPEADSQHLMGAMLVRMAQVNSHLSLAELQSIDGILARKYGLGPVEAAKMRADCERLAEALPETEFLGPMILARIPPDQRFALREALREVAEADGVIDPQERAMIEAVAGLLQEA